MPVIRDIDPRLLERGMQVIDAERVSHNGQVWRLIKARWFDKDEAGGRHHIYVEAIDEDGMVTGGIPFEVIWPTGSKAYSTNERRGFDAANHPMSPSRNEFTVMMKDGDAVRGLGMGAMTQDGFNPGIHTATLLTFQLQRANGTPAPIGKPVSHIQVIVDGVLKFDNWSDE